MFDNNKRQYIFWQFTCFDSFSWYFLILVTMCIWNSVSLINRYSSQQHAQFTCFDNFSWSVKTSKLSQVPVDETEFHTHMVTDNISRSISRKVVKTCKLSVLLRRVPVDETKFHGYWYQEVSRKAVKTCKLSRDVLSFYCCQAHFILILAMMPINVLDRSFVISFL